MLLCNVHVDEPIDMQGEGTGEIEVGRDGKVKLNGEGKEVRGGRGRGRGQATGMSHLLFRGEQQCRRLTKLLPCTTLSQRQTGAHICSVMLESVCTCT